MRFVILAQPRTGSSHLTDMLNNQKDILCNGEIFHSKGVYVRWPKAARTRKLIKELKKLKSNDPLAYLERVMDSQFGHKHVGFKIFEKQNEIALAHLMQDPGFAKVVLYRRNVLANYSSKMLAQVSGRWDQKDGKPLPDQHKVQFNVRQFTKFHDRYVGYYNWLLSSLIANRQPLHLINYEEINEPRLFSALVAYIGGDPNAVKIESRHNRQNTSNILSRFSNPEDVEAFLMARDLKQWAYEAELSLEPLKREAGKSDRESEPAP